jgi:hypothetical protein
MEELPKWTQELPGLPHKLFNDTANVVVEYYKEHLRRDVKDGRLTPPDFWVMLRGFLIAAAQTYASICILLAEKRPKPLMLQAGILNRALLEMLAGVLALTEDPAGRTQVLAREAYKSDRLSYERLTSRFGADSKWVEYLDVYRKGLEIVGKQMKLPPEMQENAAAIPDEWPTPGVMVYGRPSRKIPPYVSGSRLAVLKELYEYHYPHQSAQAHGRVAAVAVAMLVDEPSEQWNPGYGESNIVGTALLLLACLLCEIEAAGGYSHHPKLAELWTYLRDLDDEAKEVWQLRYEGLTQGTKGV